MAKEFAATICRVNSFAASLKQPPKFNTNVASILIRSDSSFKGGFEKSNDLGKISAYDGDYADVYETGTRWKFMNAKWVDTGEKIPLNPAYATQAQLSSTNERVTTLEYAIANPKLVITII